MRRTASVLALFTIFVAADSLSHGLDEPRHLKDIAPGNVAGTYVTDYGLVVETSEGFELFADEAFDGFLFDHAAYRDADKVYFFTATSKGMLISEDQGCTWSADPAFPALASDLAFAGGAIWAVSEIPGGANTLMRFDPESGRFEATEHTSPAFMHRLTQTPDDRLFMQVGNEVWEPLNPDDDRPIDELIGVTDSGVIFRGDLANPNEELEWSVEVGGQRWVAVDASTVRLPSGQLQTAWGLGTDGERVWLGRDTNTAESHLEWSDGELEVPFDAVYPSRCESAIGEATRAIWPTLVASGLGEAPPPPDGGDADGCGCATPDSGGPAGIVLVALMAIRRRRTNRPDGATP